MKRCIAAVAVLLLIAPAFGAAPAALGGRLLGVDGLPAPGFEVVLVSTAGEELLVAGTDPEGTFLFEDLEPGRYEIGIRSPQGDATPVLADPTELGHGERAVREIRLQAVEASVNLAPARGGVGVWWAGLRRSQKIWTVVGSLVGIGLVYGAIGEDDHQVVSPTDAD